MRLQLFLWWALVLSLTIFKSNLATAGNVYVPIDSSYKLTFADEFNGTSIDSSKWNMNWLGATNAITKPVNSAELGAYDPAQCRVNNGKLEMTAIKRTVTASDGKTYNYVSCLLNTHRKFLQTYGYFEARMYLPGANAKIFNWPAFWTNGDHSAYGKSWPYAGEMDIMEGLSGYAHYHFHSDSTHAGGGPNTDFTGWHIFAALWEPGKVTFYYDGIKVGTMTSGITSLPMYLILNNGISLENQYGGPMSVPATVLVDYVHVYSKDSSAVAVTPPPGYGGPGDLGEGTNPDPILDSQAPSVPSGLTGSALSTSQISISWNSSTDNVQVAGYNVYRNDQKILSLTTSRSMIDSGLSADMIYSYAVSAVDTSGNESAKSSALSIRTMSLTTPTPEDPSPVSNNLILNPGFELNLTNWSTKGNVNLISSGVRSGSRAVAISGGGATVSQIVQNLKPNTSYLVSAYLRAQSGSRISLGVKDFGSSQIAMGSSSTSYSLVQLKFKTGSSATSAKVFLYANSGGGSADDFVMTLEAATSNPEPVPEPEPSPVTSNLVLNSSFEMGALSWVPYGTAQILQANAFEGVNAGSASAGSGINQTISGLKPNTSYQLTAYLKANSSSDVAIGVKNYGNTQVAYSTSNTSYTKVTVNFTTGSTNTSALIFFYVNSGSGFVDSFNLVPR